MLDPDKAIADLQSIRAQLARGTVFRGFGPTTLAATGLVAVLAAVFQSVWLPEPVLAPLRYVLLWSMAALVSAALIGAEAVTRSRRIHSGLADDMIHAAAEQFLPAAAAGILLSLVILRFAPHDFWMLPGLWQMMLSLGVFAACRSLPSSLILVAMFYLASGTITFVVASWSQSPSAWAMGIPFFLGQMLAAGLLQFSGGDDGEE